MAKKPNEPSLPLILALVFFVLTTIAFGVMWYMTYSEQQTKDDAVKKATADLTSLRGEKAKSDRLLALYKIYLGVDSKDGEDKKLIDTEAKPNDELALELKQIAQRSADRLSAGEATNLPAELQFWGLDDAGKVRTPPPAEGLIDQIAKIKGKDAAYDAAKKAADGYNAQVALMKKDDEALKAAKAEFEKQAADFPDRIKEKVKKITDEYDARIKKYEAEEARRGKENSELTDKHDTLVREVTKLKGQVKELQENNLALNQKANKGATETFTFDEPQGKILRKLPEGVVEINIGSAAGVRPGLTFTVLPPDFPEKGRQSRMRSIRTPDARGEYKPVEVFVPKGSIEVFEVVNANLSLARIVPGSEMDAIRDGVTPGDLLYNSVWRKGVADRVALVGIFDVNGDGTDDITSVVRDLNKMGIPVDAYFDMKKRQWVGTITERTRYIVEGYFPINTVNDPNREDKSKLLGAMETAINQGKQKGVATVNFRDFFSRMGYKFRLDVNDDKINHATAPYLSNVGVGDPLVPPPSP
jgi:hypothetical protein